MNAKTLFSNDTKGILNSAAADKIFPIAEKLIGQSAETVQSTKAWATYNAVIEWAVLSALSALADEAGRSRHGNSSLGDTIMDGQAARIRQYKSQAYRLSEKQAAIVLGEIMPYLAR